MDLDEAAQNRHDKPKGKPQLRRVIDLVGLIEESPLPI
jgi:hypothetical protein